MQQVQSFIRRKDTLVLFVLIIVSCLTYLPFVRQFGYFNDDWYLMYSAGAKGLTVFRDIFSIDRPGRVLVMIPAYWLFGQNPLYYNLSAYIFRLLSGLGMYWISRLLWPRQRAASASMALLFLLYPGFLSQPNAIDYQSHIAGLAAATISIASSLRAISVKRASRRVFFFAIAILLGWFYLLQMEWYIGFEILRWGSIFLLVSKTERTLIQKIWRTIRSGFVTILIPVVFLPWRLILFTSERGATDINLQLDQFIQSPLKTGLHWVSTLLGDTLDVVALAWGQPLLLLKPWISTISLLLFAFVLGLVSVAATLLLLKEIESVKSKPDDNWQVEAFFLGLLVVLFGLSPVVMVNRYVDFASYSRYTLVASAGAAILLTGVIFSFKSTVVQRLLLAALVFVASLTHFANSLRAVQVTQATRDFWWQVSWRAPQLEKNTTLVANYAVGATEEDYFVWGPANFIYYPEGANEKYVQPGVGAAVLNQVTVEKTLRNEGQEFRNRRSIRTYKNYRRLLILTQPTVESCVHVIDGMRPEYSSQENELIQIIGPYSETDQILTDQVATPPPSIVFGPEPEYGWCYFYQKASLARQQGDWQEIIRLDTQAQKQGFAPIDLIEWMPFIQAYVEVGGEERLNELAEIISADPYIAMQACQFMENWQQASSDIPENVLELYCPGDE